MLRKLLKYDMRAIWRIWWLLGLSAMGLSVVGGLALRILNNSGEQAFPAILEVFAGLAVFACIMGFVAFFIGSELLVYYRFYKNLFTDEGYLTFTLPASRAKILASKTLNACLWLVLSVLTLGACLIIMLAISGGLADFPTFLKFFFDGADVFSLLYILLLAVEGIIILLAGSWVSVGLVHFCITIGAVLAKKYKLLAAIGIYYLLNMVLSFVLQAFMILGVFATAGAIEPLFSALSETEIMFFIPLLLALIAVIVTSVALLIHYLILGKLERRLNLA